MKGSSVAEPLAARGGVTLGAVVKFAALSS